MRRIVLVHSRVWIVLFCLAVALGVPSRARAQDPIGYIYSKVNELRASKGLNTLGVNAALTAAAQKHANYLASTIYIHPHRERDGSLPQDRAAAAGYAGRASENVVGGISATMDWAFNWWLNSSVHYNNMLSNWTEIGLGYADGGDYGKWFVIVFGNPGRAPAPSEGVTGANPATVRPGSAGGGVVRPGPTKPPPPTATPTITYTPSITYTPRASFTPTFTATFAPATATPIYFQVSTPGGPVEASEAPSDTPTPQIVAMQPTLPAPPATAEQGTPESATPSGEANNSAPLRLIIPSLIGLNVVLIGGIIVLGALRRCRG